MKELSFEQMESLNGGNPLPYCGQLWWWITNDYEGFQGSRSELLRTFMSNCA